MASNRSILPAWRRLYEAAGHLKDLATLGYQITGSVVSSSSRDPHFSADESAVL